MELHCDTASYPEMEQADRCTKNSNNNIMSGLCHHANQTVSDHLRRLKTKAKTSGWMKVKGKWMCPPCYRAAKKGARK